MARRLIAGGVLAVLWLLFGLGSYFLQFAGGSAATLARMIPSPLRGGFFGLPTGWAVTVYGLTVVLIVLAYTVIATWFARGGRVTFAAGWLAAVLTGFVVGGMLDLGDIARSLTMSISVRGAASATGSAELVVFWAFIVGWIPALTVTQRPDSAVAERAGAEDHTADDARRRPPALTALTVIAAVIAVALPIAAQSAHAASQAELQRTQAEARAQAEANADPNGAAPKDPQSTGIPVPTVAESAEPAADGSCAFDDSTMMAPPSDAATGHRVQPLQLVNIGETACTLEGYPDVAFGDQNGHLLPVTVVYGSSFMATDPGATLITLEPGQTARAALGWDANSEHGQLAARTLWAAPSAGVTRTTWDVALDIIPGTTVHITAWETGTPAAG
nr:DUF4232 domain-containing protein [Microbacterium bovistercoris]